MLTSFLIQYIGDDYINHSDMTQIQQTKLTPEQESTQFVRIILLNNFLLDYHVKDTFDETFNSLGDFAPVWLTTQQRRWYMGTRLFLEDVALELTFDGGNIRWTFFDNVLNPIWDTILGCIVLMTATTHLDSEMDIMQLRLVQSQIQTMMVYYGDDFPIVVAALKKGAEDIFSVDELRIILNSPTQYELNNLQIVICDPTDRESVKDVLITALESGLRYLDNQIAEEV